MPCGVRSIDVTSRQVRVAERLEKVHEADVVIVGSPVYYDYSRYDMNLFDEEAKRIYRDEHFEIDMENAFQLGKRLVETAAEENA